MHAVRVRGGSRHLDVLADRDGDGAVLQGLTLLRVRAQLEQLQDTLMS